MSIHEQELDMESIAYLEDEDRNVQDADLLSESDEDLMAETDAVLAEADEILGEDEDDMISDDDMYEDDLLDEELDAKKIDKTDRDLVAVSKDEKAEKDEILSREDVSLYEPITFSEEAVRVVDRGGEKLISESDFESVFYHYDGEKSGEDILATIAESHGLDASEIVIMLTEGEMAKPSPVKKGIAKGSGISSGIKMQIKRLRQQLSLLPPASPSAKAKKKEIKRLRARLALHNEDAEFLAEDALNDDIRSEGSSLSVNPESDPDLIV